MKEQELEKLAKEMRRLWDLVRATPEFKAFIPVRKKLLAALSKPSNPSCLPGWPN